MLKIENLHASVEGKEILKGIDLTVNPGEVHAIMGPNGSGKSTLASVLAGREEYEITDGEILYDGQDLAELDAETRARDEHARARGVTGVPTFVVGNRHVVPGAQPPELWAQVIAELGPGAGTQG